MPLDPSYPSGVEFIWIKEDALPLDPSYPSGVGYLDQGGCVATGSFISFRDRLSGLNVGKGFSYEDLGNFDEGVIGKARSDYIGENGLSDTMDSIAKDIRIYKLF